LLAEKQACNEFKKILETKGGREGIHGSIKTVLTKRLDNQGCPTVMGNSEKCRSP